MKVKKKIKIIFAQMCHLGFFSLKRDINDARNVRFGPTLTRLQLRFDNHGSAR